MVNYIKKGTGDLQIVFIHGNSQSHNSWNLVVSELSEKTYEMIQLDLPGCGKSQDFEHFSITEISNAVKSLIAEIGDKAFILVGNSLGTNIIAEIVNDLENCKGVFLNGSCCFGMGKEPKDIFLPNPLSGVCFSPNPDKNDVMAFFQSGMVNPELEILSDAMADFNTTNPDFREQLGNEFQLAFSGKMRDELQQLKELNYPVANTFGERDSAVNHQYMDDCGIEFWRGKTQIIPNSGHFSHLDQPKAFAKLLNEFCDSLALNKS